MPSFRPMVLRCDCVSESQVKSLLNIQALGPPRRYHIQPLEVEPWHLWSPRAPQRVQLDVTNEASPVWPGGHTAWARMLPTPCATDGAGGHRLCPGGQGPGWHCCLSDLLFLCRIPCLLPTRWKQKETNKETKPIYRNFTKVEMSEKYTEEKNHVSFQDHHC